jgi:hypothetical protein
MMIRNKYLSGKGLNPGSISGKAYIFKDIVECDCQIYSITNQEIEEEKLEMNLSE